MSGAAGATADRGGESVAVPFRLETPSRGWPIHGEYRRAATSAPGIPAPGVLVVLHDLFGSKDSGFLPFLARRLSERFDVVRFTFSGAGVDPGDSRIASPERFEANTVTFERDDLRCVLRALGSGEIDPRRNGSDAVLGLVGHGLGGTVALLEAGAAHARAVATLGARSDLRLLSESERIEVHERGWIEFADERSSGGKLRLSRRFFEDLERHAAESALEHALSSLQARLLFVHGEEDSQVACAESEALFHWSRKDGARMILVEKTGHAFGTKEPFTGPSSDLERVVGSLLAFFESAV